MLNEYNFIFQNSDHDMVIGRVFVKDLDDWDLQDKKFEWENFWDKPATFSLNQDNGDITMASTVVPQTYNLRFKVSHLDRSYWTFSEFWSPQSSRLKF